MEAEMKLKTAVILAAGQGSRMNEKIEDGFSKAMALVMGKPLISFIIDALITIGITEIIVIKRVDDFGIYNIREYYKNINFKFVTDEICNGSLNSFLTAESAVQYPFFLTDCDIICSKYHFSRMIQRVVSDMQNDSDLLGFVTVIDSPIDGSEKMLKVDDKRAIAFNKKGFENGVCGGMIYLFLKNPFEIAKSVAGRNITSYATFFNELLSKEKIYTMHIDEMWDVDTIEDIKMTEKLLRGDNK